MQYGGDYYYINGFYCGRAECTIVKRKKWIKMRFHEHYNGWIVWESMKKSKHVTEVQQESSEVLCIHE